MRAYLVAASCAYANGKGAASLTPLMAVQRAPFRHNKIRRHLHMRFSGLPMHVTDVAPQRVYRHGVYISNHFMGNTRATFMAYHVVLALDAVRVQLPSELHQARKSRSTKDKARTRDIEPMEKAKVNIGVPWHGTAASRQHRT